MADMSPWGSIAMAGNLGGQGASGAPSDTSGGGLPRPGGTSVLPGSGLPTAGGSNSGSLPGGGTSIPTGGFAQNSGTPMPAPLPTGGGMTGGGMTGAGGLSGAPGMFHSQGWYANRPGLANPYAGQIGATSPGGGGIMPRPGGTLPPNGGIGAAGNAGGVGGAGMANNAGNSGIGPLIQLLMGGAGQGGGIGGLLQQLMQHSQGWLGNRQDPNWLAQHPNAVGIGGTPMPGPGGTGPQRILMGQPNPGPVDKTVQGPQVPQNFGPAMSAFLPPSMGGQGQGGTVGNTLANINGEFGPPSSQLVGGGNTLANINGEFGPPSSQLVGGMAPASGTAMPTPQQIPQYAGPPIPSLVNTLAMGQQMAPIVGMQNSPNPVLQNMAPLLMQQLMQSGAKPTGGGYSGPTTIMR